MLNVPASLRIFAARNPADFRKQVDGLAGIVRSEFGLDPLSGHLFVFFNKRRDKIKLLVFEHTGYWLHYKRLELGTFQAITNSSEDLDCIEVDARQLRLLLEGIDLKKTKFRRHFKDPLRIESRQRNGTNQGPQDRLRKLEPSSSDQASRGEGR